MSGIQYHRDIKLIVNFEHQNNIIINIFGYEDKKIFPLHISTVIVDRHHSNLLYTNAGEKSHYASVKYLNRLVLRQYNNHNNKIYFF